MKRVSVSVAIVLCWPLAAMGQTPPVPSVPPAPPAPVVAPAPPVAAVPPAPAAPPVPVAPPAPMLLPLPAPVFDHVDLGHIDLDIAHDIEMAMDAAHEAMASIDHEAIADKALREIDVEGIRAQVKEQAERMKEQAERLKEIAKERADVWKEQALEKAKLATEEALKMRDFSYTFQGPGGFALARSGSDSGAYNSGMSAMHSRQYDRAIARFDQVIAQKGQRADGAMYWKAFAQYKLGKTDEAIATLGELRRAYPQSRYLDDARVLEADARKTAGKPLTGDADTDELKLLAISSMQNTNPEGAVPLLENVLKGSNSPAVKRRAIHVLSYNDQPAAHQVLLNYAKGRGNPDLQIEAIRYLTARRGKTTSAELEEIYSSTQDVDVRSAVLSALVSTGDRAAVLRIAQAGSAPIELRRSAISNLSRGSLASPAELMTMYQKEENRELKLQIVRGLGSLSAVDQLGQILKTEKDSAVRQQAIRSLGNIRTEAAAKTLTDLYGAEQDHAVKKTIISAMGSQNNADALIAMARRETALDLKVEIVRRLVDLAPKNKAAADFLVEQIK